jgi:hypothetical protein
MDFLEGEEDSCFLMPEETSGMRKQELFPEIVLAAFISRLPKLSLALAPIRRILQQ